MNNRSIARKGTRKSASNRKAGGTLPQIAIAYLKSRGVKITAVSLKKRGIYWDPDRGLVMPVCGPDGKPVPGLETCRRYNSFTRKFVNGKRKFDMTPGMGAPPMFDPCGDYNKKALIIGEGPMRMFAAHDNLNDAACIAVNGIYGWTVKDSKRQQMHPVLRDMDWRGRIVYTAFDKGSEDVQEAEQFLASLLVAAGAIVRHLDWDSGKIPRVNGSDKPGLDDLLAEYKYTSVQEMDKLGIFAPIKLDKKFLELHAMNEELAVIRSLGKYYRLDADSSVFLNERLCSHHDANTVLYANRICTNGEGKPVSVFAEWNRWPHRREYERLVYTPGKSNEIYTQQGTELNVWSGWGVEPVKGDIAPFVELVDHLFTDQPEGHKEYFWQWIAYPFQNPGARMFVAYLLYSPARKDNKGNGKTLLAYILGDIYGRNTNFKEITNDQIQSTSEFNGWIMGKQFILIDEILMSRKRRDNQKLKKLITQENVEARLMRTDPFSMPSHYNIIMTSDQEDALYIENGERRFAVVNIQVPPKSPGFYGRLAKWRKNVGPFHLFHYLLHEVDCKGFNPHAPAPFSDTREELREQSKTDEDHWAEELRHELEQKWRYWCNCVKEPKPIREVYSAAELTDRFNEGNAIKKEGNAIGRALGRVGYEKRSVKIDGTTVRMWAVINPKRWAKKDSNAWAVEYKREGA